MIIYLRFYNGAVIKRVKLESYKIRNKTINKAIKDWDDNLRPDRFIRFACCNVCYTNIIKNHKNSPSYHDPCDKCNKKIKCISNLVKNK